MNDMTPGGGPVLRIEDLSIDFPTSKGVVHAVTGLSLAVAKGRRVGFIGESGSGKTTTALAVMRMLAPPGRVAGGRIDLAGIDMLSLTEEETRRARLSKVAYIPQGAMNSLNPIMRIEDQLWDAVTTHEGVTDRARPARGGSARPWAPRRRHRSRRRWAGRGLTPWARRCATSPPPRRP